MENYKHSPGQKIINYCCYNVEFESKQLTEKKEIMSAFNRHFTSVCPLLAGNIEGKMNDDPIPLSPAMKNLLSLNLSPLLCSMYYCIQGTVELQIARAR